MEDTSLPVKLEITDNENRSGPQNVLEEMAVMTEKEEFPSDSEGIYEEMIIENDQITEQPDIIKTNQDEVDKSKFPEKDKSLNLKNINDVNQTGEQSHIFDQSSEETQCNSSNNSEIPNTGIITPLKCNICKSNYHNFTSEATLNKHMTRFHSSTHTCNICKEDFAFEYVLRDHMKSEHPGENPYKCNICSKSFLLEESLNKHVKTIHSNALKSVSRPMHNCTICNKTFKTEGNFKLHMIEHGKQNLDVFALKPVSCHSCSVCNKTFEKEKDLKQHTIKFHFKPNVLNKCKFCDKTLSSMANLKYHMATLHGIKPKDWIKCKFCDKSYSSMSILKIHMATFHKKILKCRRCDKSFSTEGQLKYHVLINHNLNKCLKCKICQKVFISKRSLMTHTNNFHSEKKCTICEVTFSSMSDLNDHMTSTHSEKTLRIRHKCGICNQKSFSLKSDLDYHMKSTHYSEKNQAFASKCSFCSKNFSKIKIKWHMIDKHSRLKTTYKCSICKEQEFALKSELKDHMILHVKEVHKYNICDDKMTFSQKSYLTYHMAKIPTEEQEFPPKCFFCDQIFLNKSDFSHHMLSTHAERFYKCGICKYDKEFIQKSDLSCHMMSIHSEEKLMQECSICKTTFVLKSELSYMTICIRLMQKKHEKCGICVRKHFY